MNRYTRYTYPLAKVQTSDGTWREPTKEEAEAMQKILDAAMKMSEEK